MYICKMQGLNKFVKHIVASSKSMLEVTAFYTCNYSAFDKQFNYFPTYKDFNN